MYIIMHFHIVGTRCDIKCFLSCMKYQMMMSGDCVIIARQTRIQVEINIHIHAFIPSFVFVSGLLAGI